MKRIALFIASILISSVLFSQKTIDDFSSNNGWEEKNFSFLSSKVENGYFTITTKNTSKGDALLLKDATIDWKKNWSIEVKVKFPKSKTKNNRNFELFMGATDVKNAFVCNILENNHRDDDMRYCAYFLVNGGGKDLGLGSYIGKPFPETIPEDLESYTLKIEHRNGGFSYIINDVEVFVGYLPLSGFKGTKIGFNIGSYTSVSIDHLSIEQDLKEKMILPVKVPTMSGGIKWAFNNEKGERIVDAKYDGVSGFIGGYSMVQLGKKIGFIDETGREICPVKYDFANKFVNGFAQVGKIDYSTRNKKRKMQLYGFINEQGQEITHLQYGMATKDFTKSGLAVVSYDIYNDLGNVVDTKFGVINGKGKLIISYDLPYKEFSFIKDGYIIAKNNSQYDLFDLNGTKINKTNCYGIWLIPKNVQTMFIVKVKVNTSGNWVEKYGVMNSKGEMVLKPNFSNITRFDYNEGKLARVYFNNEMYFYIDKGGNCVEFEGVLCPEE